MADHQKRHQTLLYLYSTTMKQGIKRTSLTEETLGISVTRSQRMSLLNLQVSFVLCHSKTSGIGKSETTAFQQLDVHERKKICQTQTQRKYQISTAASILPKTWLSLTIRVKFTHANIKSSHHLPEQVKLRDVSPSHLHIHKGFSNGSFSNRWCP